MVSASVMRLSMRHGLPWVKLWAAASAAGSMMVPEVEPVVRVMVEAQSDEVCRKYVDLMVQKMGEEKLIVE